MEALGVVKATTNRTSLLRRARQYRVRCSPLTLYCGTDYVTTGVENRLGDEAWQIYEQVLLGALDVGDNKLAEAVLQRLRSKFAESGRLSRLEGLKEEACGRYAEATAAYQLLIDQTPLNAMALKRLICISKAEGNLSEAITRLNTYVRQFAGDIAAWQELAALYHDAGDSKAAVFCLEELVMNSPTNFVFHSKLASAYYSLGGVDHFRLARMHYAQAIEVHGDGNLRALFGLCQVCYGLALCATDMTKGRQASGAITGCDTPVNIALFKMARDRIVDYYSQVNPKLLASVKGGLRVQEVAVLGME